MFSQNFYISYFMQYQMPFKIIITIFFTKNNTTHKIITYPKHHIQNNALQKKINADTKIV
ncbi:TPA: helix-turn-helix domain-containing protein [Escherichia coli]